MFLRNIEDLSAYLQRTNFLEFVDENNLSRKSLIYIKRFSQKVKDKKILFYFKYWVLWRWINKNFELSEKFSNQLKRNIKKLKISVNSREEAFIFQLDELVFNSWRPLKQLPVKFELEKKEAINLIETHVNLHRLVLVDKEYKPKMIGNFDLYYSNKKIYFTNEKQEIQRSLPYNEIESVTQRRYGLEVHTKFEKLLFRGKNRLLSYLLLQRMVPNLELDVTKLDDLYQYFDYWNKILKKIY